MVELASSRALLATWVASPDRALDASSTAGIERTLGDDIIIAISLRPEAGHPG